jgi:hypothetical protein
MKTITIVTKSKVAIDLLINAIVYEIHDLKENEESNKYEIEQLTNILNQICFQK